MERTHGSQLQQKALLILLTFLSHDVISSFKADQLTHTHEQLSVFAVRVELVSGINLPLEWYFQKNVNTT